MELQHISKEYPGVKALDDVSISFKKGEVHALIGENGAGKSTFIKIISGAVRPDSGTISFKGCQYTSMEPSQSRDIGIAVVYQELIQYEAMTVSDNIYSGIKTSKGKLFVDDKSRRQITRELLDKLNCNVPADALIRDLSVANRQIVEIAKAMVKNASIVIMDEPTAAITVEEQQRLFEIIRQLRADHVTVIYISHRLEELFEICDRVTVLRDGKYVDTVDIAGIDKHQLIGMMVGRELSETYPAKQPAEEEVVLRAENLSGNGLEDINFELKRGEILGFAGLVGAGRTELMHLIFGAAQKTNGKIYIKDTEVDFASPKDGLDAGIALIPEDRKTQGCFLDKPIYWNISVSNLKKLCHGLFVDGNAEMQQAREYQSQLKIKTPDLTKKVLSLSGGNQQKVSIAKCLSVQPDIMIFDEPTRGIDVGARYEIYSMMVELTKKGKSVLMVSSDMEELLGMSERIVVLHEGRQTGILTRDQFSQERVMKLASAVKEDSIE